MTLNREILTLFTSKDPTHIRLVCFCNCKIDSIDKKTFENLTNLIEMNLYDNNLKELHSEYFNDLISLKNLWLGNNYFKQIESGLFFKLQNLLRIDLARNKINDIGKFVFTFITYLRRK